MVKYPRGSRPSQVGVRAAWGMADQAISSLTNFVLSLLAARSLDRAEFGSFALVYSAYLVVGGMGQALASSPLAVRYTAATDDKFQGAAEGAAGTALVIGMASCLIFSCVGLVLRQLDGVALIVLGISMPGLMLQDAWRFVFVARGHPRKAALNDLTWGSVQLAGTSLIFGLHRQSTPALIGAWGLGAASAAILGCSQAGIIPRPLRSIDWLRSHANLSIRYLFEGLVVRGFIPLTLAIVGVLVGILAVGSLRGAQLLFAPLNLFYVGGFFVMVPEGVRALRHGGRAFDHLVIALSTISVLLSVGWFVFALLIPFQIGHQLLGATWITAHRLLAPIGLQIIALASTTGPQMGLRALAAARSSLRCQMAYAFLALSGTVLGALAAGVSGAALGGAAGTLLAAIFWWRTFSRQTGSRTLLAQPRD